VKVASSYCDYDHDYEIVLHQWKYIIRITIIIVIFSQLRLFYKEVPVFFLVIMLNYYHPASSAAS
jgi:hypothetical protein